MKKLLAAALLIITVTLTGCSSLGGKQPDPCACNNQQPANPDWSIENV